MECDDTPTIEDPDDAAWVAAQREVVERYLASQRVEHSGVSLEPRWFVSPYVAVWAIRSRANPDRIGWWAISGDVPTDYMTCGREQDAGDILIGFAARWRDAAKQMAIGQHPDDGFVTSDSARARELAPLLASRAELLYEFGMREKSDGPTNES